MAEPSTASGPPSNPETALCSDWIIAPRGPSIASGPKRSSSRSAEGGCGSTLLKVPFSWEEAWYVELLSCQDNQIYISPN